MLGSTPRRLLAVLAPPLFALTLTVVPATVQSVAAASTKVVIVVGPVGDPLTSDYISEANTSAAVFRKYTSNVTTIYSPHATWAAVAPALQGANVVLYLGHGNGFPSPYSSTLNRNSMDGFGLNATDSAGNYNWTYYGEAYIASQVRLAPNAVVLFSRLCYASGNSEWGAGTPTLSVAEQRVGNYAAGFIAAGAKAVIADGVGDITWYENALFTTHSTIDALFRAAPNAHKNFVTFGSSRSAGYTAILDVGTYSWVPDGDPYYRSMVSIPSLSTDSVVGGTPSLNGKTTTYVNMRWGPGTGYAIETTYGPGTAFTVIGAFTTDSLGRTWVPINVSGRTGYIASWYATFSGSATATAPLNMRTSASTGASILTVVPQGARFTVTGSTADSLSRTWLAIGYGGRSGWVASWYTKP